MSKGGKIIQTFIVSVELPSDLEPTVVTNYVNMALNKYDKLAKRLNADGYFDGTKRPIFHISCVPHSNGKDLREIIKHISFVQKHVDMTD